MTLRFAPDNRFPSGPYLAVGWAWSVPAAFRQQLGIQWVTRSNQGVKSKTWAQVSSPGFMGGEIFYTHTSAYGASAEACHAIQITDSYGDSVEFRWYRVDEEGRFTRLDLPLQGMSNEGFVRMLQYGPTNPPADQPEVVPAESGQ